MTCELCVLLCFLFIYSVSGTFLFKLAVYTEAALYTVPHSNASYDHNSTRLYANCIHITRRYIMQAHNSSQGRNNSYS